MRFTVHHVLWLILAAVPGRADDALRAGDEAYAKCDVPRAVESYRSARRADPKNYEATWKLARALNDQALLMPRSPAQKSLYLESESLAQEAIRLDPADSKGYLYLSIAEGKVALFEGGKKKVELGKDVKTEAEKAIALNPREDLAYHVLGIWNREMATLNPFLRTFAEWFYGKFPPASLDAAVTDFKKAIAINDRPVAHHVELGLTYLAMKQWTEARDEFQKALALPRRYPADGIYQQQARDGLEQATKRIGA